MKKDIELVSIPDDLRELIGEPDEGTQMFKQYGSDAEFQPWWDAVCKICPEGCLPPGCVAMYASVSRAGVHKRMREGRITAFVFYAVEWEEDEDGEEVPGSEASMVPYVYIPLREARDWGELRRRAQRKEEVQDAPGDGEYESSLVVRGKRGRVKMRVRKK